MKTLKTLAVSAILIAIMLGFAPGKAQAETTNSAKFTCTADSVKLTWSEDPAYADHEAYTIISYAIRDIASGELIAADLDPAVTTYVKEGLGRGYVGQWGIEVNYTTAYGETASANIANITVSTFPAICDADDLSCTSDIDYKGHKIKFTSAPYAANGEDYTINTEIKLYKGSTLVKTISYSGTESDYIAISANTCYKYKARYTIVYNETQRKLGGPWSDYKYFDMPEYTYSYTIGTRGAKITLKRAVNLYKYVIYVSTSQDSGYKKTMTVYNPSSTAKKKTVSLTKIGTSYMKKGKRYYIRVVPYIQLGGSTHKSEITRSFSFVNPK